MAASVQQPVVVPRHYDPMFKVDVMLHAPLREHLGSASDLKVDMMYFSLQLDTLCKQELAQIPSHRIDHGRTSNSFNDKASVVHSNLQQALSKYYSSSSLKIYFEETGLDKVFPRVAAYVTRPDSFSLTYKSTYVDNYLKQMSHIQQLLSLAKQIHEDVTYQPRPKYLAHQMAVLYQSVNSLPSGAELFSRHRSNIEENFKVLKEAVAEISEEGDEPLATEVRTWILDLTDNIIQALCSLPSGLTEEILPLASVLHR